MIGGLNTKGGDAGSPTSGGEPPTENGEGSLAPGGSGRGRDGGPFNSCPSSPLLAHVA